MLGHVKRLVRAIIRIGVRLAAACVLVIGTLLLVTALRDRRMPDLEPWHERAPREEFGARDARRGFDFDDYLALENGLFAQLGAWAIDPGELKGRSKVLRFVEGGPSDPATFDRNWNRTTELVPDSITGGALLVHGLTDSPYSMRSTAELLQRNGFYSLCLRLPGHGTVPAALLTVSWKDWARAVRIGMQHVRKRVGDGKPIYLCGYSCGGALAVLHTLEALEDGALVVPDRVVLFSPAIGVTALARASNSHELYSWLPYFEKSQWLSIDPEYDPFKYNSFPKNAGAQMWAVTRAVQSELELAETDGRLARMPPVLTFQSTVDSTIIAADVAERLYRKMPSNGSELVVFDVNRVAVLDGLYREARTTLEELQHDRALPFTLTVVENADAGSPAVVTMTVGAARAEEERTPLGLEWPHQVYSLAHVAIPFPPDDPLYGEGLSHVAGGHVPIGDLSLRGEKHVLVISAADLLRLRYNPFHAYMVQKIEQSFESTDLDSSR